MVGDGHRTVGTPLRAAQDEAGVSPGVWKCRGLAAVGLVAGDVVSERQAELLLGEGRHPDADRIEGELLAVGESPACARWATVLGRPIEHNASPKTERAKERTPWLALDLVFRAPSMAHIAWALEPGAWQETELLLWKPPAAWFSINAFFTAAGLRNWYVNFEHPTRRTETGFDTLDLAVDLVIEPDLTTWTWKDEDEYVHVRRLGIVTDTEHQAVELARAQVLVLFEDRAGPFAHAERWAAWRWELAWTLPRLPSVA